MNNIFAGNRHLLYVMGEILLWKQKHLLNHQKKFRFILR